MAEATWGDAASPELDWRMSAALENVPRGGETVAEVTSLAQAVREWLTLDPELRAEAVLTPEAPLVIDGASLAQLKGEHIGLLAEWLPPAD
ncbi:hypothetical protein SAMN06297144_2074 [Sphingomonas guangdongensis]|uniref:Uncharacterized protein n=1 Tax=Sphingomonas guangdongensis TaxID=1141890 RepID=A0A285QYA5_9SPHN|nr:hypothetical protein [Sphingomonas guangdongensis]SOB86955.1 hypothetical protein SAMN06297144_2074 [Sphingomonas guangdongensis]